MDSSSSEIPEPKDVQETFGPLAVFSAWQPIASSTPPARVRWPVEGFPLSVAAKGDARSAGRIFSIVREWEVLSGGLVRFTFAGAFENGGAEEGCEDPNQSVCIRFVRSREATPGREFEVGHTDRTVNPEGQILQAVITLLENPAIDAQLGESAQSERFRATILHETGHALGLEHSTNPRDVMFHQGWRNATLSPGDIQALQLLYKC